MTFALKDFETLKKEFNDKVTVILKREQLDKSLEKLPEVKDLPPRRRDEILFLTTVLAQLEAKEINHNLKSVIFYGAMLLIQKDIKNNLNTEGVNVIARMETVDKSLLHSSLNEVMNKKADNMPTHTQFSEFYREINSFLKRIFADSDSRKGLSKSHALQVIPFERLADLVSTAYKLEEASTKSAIAEMSKDGKTKPDAMVVNKYAPKALTDALGSWEDLKKSLETLIQDERASKNKATVKALSPERAIQLQFLQTVSQALTHSKNWGITDPQKVAILTGCMYLVREQIRAEYKMAPLSREDIPKGIISSGSVVEEKLTGLLKAKTESVENIEAVLAAANEFLRHMAVERVVDKHIVKHSFRAEHFLSGIEGLDLAVLLNLAQKMIKTCRLEALQRCVTDVKKELEAAKPKEASTSYFSSAYGWFTKKPKVEEDEDDDEELDDTKEASASTTTAKV